MIHQLSMRDFMTFDHVDIEFGNKINLVLGPNGTGRVSCVNWLLIGSKELGRARS